MTMMKEKNGPKSEEPKDNLALIIEKFVKREKHGEVNFWSREMRIAKSLIKERGAAVFNFMSLGYFLNSMAFFKTEKGKHEIDKSLKMMKLLEVKKNVDNFDLTEYNRVTERKKTFKERLID